MRQIWGIDLGGTKIEGVILESIENRTPLHRIRIDTEADKGYGHIISRINTLYEMMAEKAGEKSKIVGLGTPGTRDPHTGLMKNCNTTALNGRPLLKDLLDSMKIDIRMANDANCFALAEARMGAGRGAETVFGVIMGTGVGGGVVVDGHVLNGSQGIAGEWGHNILIPDGPDCYCGRKGCVETVISGTGLELYYKKLTGTRIKLKEIVEKAGNGSDPSARAVMDYLLENFGKAMAVVINILDPHIIVLGGGVSNVEELYALGPAEVGKWVFNNRLDTRIVKNELGDSAGVFGAAMLAV